MNEQERYKKRVKKAFETLSNSNLLSVNRFL
jgi:hypothetical protein